MLSQYLVREKKKWCDVTMTEAVYFIHFIYMFAPLEASNEVMIMRHAQFKQIRELTFKNAVTALDYLIFYLAYHRSFNVIAEVISLVFYFLLLLFHVEIQLVMSSFLCCKEIRDDNEILVRAVLGVVSVRTRLDSRPKVPQSVSRTRRVQSNGPQSRHRSPASRQTGHRELVCGIRQKKTESFIC